MKNLVLLIGILFTLSIAQGQTPYFNWAKSISGSGQNEGRAIAVDALGNVYTTGFFSGTADFDAGPNIVTLTTDGDLDIFVSKLDAAGNFVWAHNMGGAKGDIGHGIAVDNTGNVYITGYFSGTVDFDPGPNVTNLVSNGEFQDIFLCKLNTSGNFQWARSIGGISVDEGWDITLDENENVYITGQFSTTADFDPSSGIQNLTSVGSQDIFVAKFDANGIYIWAKAMGGFSNDYGESIAVDASGVYITGSFGGTADFDPSGATYNITTLSDLKDSFVLKLGTSGSFVWAKQFGGSGFSGGTSIALDASGNVYSTGLMNGTVDFDPNSGVQNLTAQGGLDGYTSKLTSDGDYIWAKRVGGNQNDYANAIAIDATGNVYTTGFFGDIVDFDPGSGVYKLEYVGASDIFVSKLDTDGAFIWTSQLGGTDGEIGSSIALDVSGNVYTTGYYLGKVDFDPNTPIYNITSSETGTDIYVHKMSPTALGVNAYDYLNKIGIYPNPSKGNIIIEGTNDIIGSTATFYNLLGQKIKEFQLNMAITNQILDKGVYLLVIEKVNNKVSKKIIIN